ncbi:MAG TPA: LppP/LprE family lipoprotein [Actinomycetota bacterium]|nr:LppP/LprE family lipoprotein [Actinomycetota bacterium]
MPSATSALSSAGPYTTVQAAETYANGQTGAPFTFSTVSWQAGATLKVLHGTPSESAGYGGDFYFFFVNGRSVGTHSFAQATASSLVGGTGFQVTFEVYKPGDPMCCPSGGQSTVMFSWNGTSLSTSGSLAGANLS